MTSSEVTSSEAANAGEMVNTLYGNTSSYGGGHLGSKEGSKASSSNKEEVGLLPGGLIEEMIEEEEYQLRVVLPSRDRLLADLTATLAELRLDVLDGDITTDEHGRVSSLA